MTDFTEWPANVLAQKRERPSRLLVGQSQGLRDLSVGGLSPRRFSGGRNSSGGGSRSELSNTGFRAARFAKPTPRWTHSIKARWQSRSFRIQSSACGGRWALPLSAGPLRISHGMPARTNSSPTRSTSEASDEKNSIFIPFSRDISLRPTPFLDNSGNFWNWPKGFTGGCRVNGGLRRIGQSAPCG